MSRYLCQLLQTLWKNHFSSATLILITSLHILLELLKYLLLKAKRKWKSCSMISRQQQRLNWVARWRNLPNVIIDERVRGLTWVKIIVITKFVPQLNSQIQKNKLNDLQESLERCCNVLLVFGFNKAKYGLNLFKSYLLPILANERNIEPTVIKKANQFISFKFGYIQLLDMKNFLGGATSFGSFWKAYEASKKKGVFPYEWLYFTKPSQHLLTQIYWCKIPSIHGRR